MDSQTDIQTEMWSTDGQYCPQIALTALVALQRALSKDRDCKRASTVWDSLPLGFGAQLGVC